MAKKNAATGYNTHLASEYLIMSLLYRAGKDAYLSIGNKKEVDIIVKTEKGSICIIEVKGSNGYTWPTGNKGKLPKSDNLFYALVCYNTKIKDINTPPDFWLIPSSVLSNLSEYKVSANKKTVYVSRKLIREKYKDYKSFKWLDEYLKTN